jgi:hypothetical protein
MATASSDPAEQLARAARLREVQAALQQAVRRHPSAARALDVLERDLLPRSAGGDLSLVVGIVGPNNAGKSALFNALVGRNLSPSLPAGGATRRLVGAAHPTLLARLCAEPTLARFQVCVQPDTSVLAATATRGSTNPAELLVAETAGLPPELMLIDTPDFDSILADNRLASESLLTVADLVIAVVTRHSYQNREVVTFLRRWLAGERPWLLVYNEAIDDTVTGTHAAKLASDVGAPPLAVFAAPHDLAVQRQQAPLVPRQLGGAGVGQSLQDMLFHLEAAADIKAHAMAAALGRLRADLAELAAACSTAASQSAAVLHAASERSLELATRVAAVAMPAGPFIEAFRTVIDRRSNPISRGWRAALRSLRIRLERLPGLLRGRNLEPASHAVSIASFEEPALRAAWSQFWEDLVRDLGPEARHLARRNAASDVVSELDRDLTEARSAEARERVLTALRDEPADLSPFSRSCEVLIDRAIDARGFDLDIQAAADIATVLPLALAAAIIVKTGGLGSDLAAAGGGALGSFLFEKYAHVLGAGIMAEARQNWVELRSRQLAEVITTAALLHSATALRASATADAALAATLRSLLVGLV